MSVAAGGAGVTKVGAQAWKAALFGQSRAQGMPGVRLIPDYDLPFNPAGSVGGAKVWSMKARLKAAQLPVEGKIRFVPGKNYSPSSPLRKGPNGGFIDRFENEWVKGPSRTIGQPFEWDVQLSNTGRLNLGWASRDGSHVNVSPDGRLTHR